MGSRRSFVGCTATAAVATAVVFLQNSCVPTTAFSAASTTSSSKQQRTCAAFLPKNNNNKATAFGCIDTRLGLVPPPGSGYAGPEYEIDEMPESYEPMMEYPGTMRPGRTPENMPFHDLPIGDDDPDPVPWPHFQQIEWHHRWAPPHPHPIPMEEFIEQEGRWATPEMEAEMRAGSRRASRTRREMEEEQKRDTLIMDDDDDDDEDLADELPQELGEGMFGQLGSTDDAKIIADAVSPDRMNVDSSDKKEDDDDDDDDAGLDDFLLDLGLDSLGDDDDDDDDDDAGGDVQPAKASPTKSIGLEDVVITEDDEDDGMPEEESVNPDVTASIDVDDDDDDLELGLDEEDDLDDSMEVPLEDFGDDDDGMDADNFFDDGGFDYGDGDGGGDFDGGFD
eukprot:CAMPEP_0201149566 /NCGR_PEP_ID=MMETSP0851-20130426/10840_1 /ASSEMBLY_ACC=CAM_ASM_000631 /TAXON_ID=183588 /ORGANISM="Pseudo-nitzschia fraudulenta, Strain WWA7" /LENGTH=393 /DNA_ID=CAMNT_0047425991 /DNA_START=69 /DNA_END=1250 /DNA_ORIENTATION=-